MSADGSKVMPKKKKRKAQTARQLTIETRNSKLLSSVQEPPSTKAISKSQGSGSVTSAIEASIQPIRLSIGNIVPQVHRDGNTDLSDNISAPQRSPISSRIPTHDVCFTNKKRRDMSIMSESTRPSTTGPAPKTIRHGTGNEAGAAIFNFDDCEADKDECGGENHSNDNAPDLQPDSEVKRMISKLYECNRRVERKLDEVLKYYHRQENNSANPTMRDDTLSNMDDSHQQRIQRMGSQNIEFEEDGSQASRSYQQNTKSNTGSTSTSGEVCNE